MASPTKEEKKRRVLIAVDLSSWAESAFACKHTLHTPSAVTFSNVIGSVRAICWRSLWSGHFVVVLCDTSNWNHDNDTGSDIAKLDTTAIPELHMKRQSKVIIPHIQPGL